MPPTSLASSTPTQPPPPQNWKERLSRARAAANSADLVGPVWAWLRANPFLLALIALLIPLGYGLKHFTPWLNGPPEWRWIYDDTFDFWPVFLKGVLGSLAGLVVIGGACAALRSFFRRPAARRAVTLLALVLFGFFYHWLGYEVATKARIDHWGRIILDAETTSYFTVAQWIRDGKLPPLRETLRRYPELLHPMPQHASTHPPGAVLLSCGVLRFMETHPRAYEAVARFYKRLGFDHEGMRYKTTRLDAVAAAALGTLLILLGVLAAVPLFFLVREALAGAPEAEAVAWSAAALWITYPALMIFEPEFDQAWPVIVLACLWAAQRGLRGRPLLWGAVVGATFMLAIFFSFVLLFLALMLVLLAALELARRAGSWRPRALLAQARPSRPEGRRLWLMVAGALAVCFAIDALLRGIWGIRLLENFIEASRWQRIAHLPRVHRHYHIWLFFNVYDFLFFGGTVLAILALAWTIRVERALHHSLAPLTPTWLIFPLTTLILNVSGLTPAETSRIWLFLAPGVAWAGASELVRRCRGPWRVNLAVLLLAQAAFYYLCRASMTFIDK